MLLDHSLRPRIGCSYEAREGRFRAARASLSVLESRACRRHQPEKTVLHGIIREHLETLLGQARSADGDGHPRLMEGEFRKYLDSGLLCRGFARLSLRAVTTDSRGRGAFPDPRGKSGKSPPFPRELTHLSIPSGRNRLRMGVRGLPDGPRSPTRLERRSAPSARRGRSSEDAERIPPPAMPDTGAGLSTTTALQRLDPSDRACPLVPAPDQERIRA